MPQIPKDLHNLISIQLAEMMNISLMNNESEHLHVLEAHFEQTLPFVNSGLINKRVHYFAILNMALD